MLGWPTYVCRINGALAWISVSDHAVVEHLGTKPWLVKVAVELFWPRSDGSAGFTEDVELRKLSCAIISHLEQTIDATPVGSVLMAGRQELTFYAHGSDDASDRVLEVLEDFWPYRERVTVLVKEDPEWSYYQRMIEPSTEEWLTAYNYAQVEALRMQGDRLAAARPVRHRAAFAAEPAREEFAAWASGAGYLVTGASGDRDFRFPFALVFVRSDPVELEAIDQVVSKAVAKVMEFGGAYYGWEASKAQRIGWWSMLWKAISQKDACPA